MKTKNKLLKGVIGGALLLGGLTLGSCGKNNTDDPIVIDPTTTEAQETILTVSQLLALIPDQASDASEQRYYVRAKIVSIDNPSYGQMTITDGTNTISVYGTYDKTGEKRYSEMTEKPIKNDEVLLYATVQNFNGTKEIKSGWIIEFTKGEIEVDITKYTTSTILEARNSKDGSLIRTSGTVAAITYANGQIPSGFYLYDDTASIYVYSDQIASTISVGNEIEIVGEKDYYILSTEQENANKYDYMGSNQLTDAVLINKKDETSTINIDNAHELTVKEALSADFNLDITNTIYCSTAIINKVNGTGFVNYYINDLDNTTGSYVYTQCNGADFSWLDEYDGKIVTLYYAIINAKATSTGCVWRMIPITVEDNGYKFDVANTNDFVYEYYVKDEFLDLYTGNPLHELPAHISSTILGFDNVEINYSSSNTEVVYFSESNGNVILNTKNNGTATITITLNYNGNIKTYEKEITVSLADEVNYISVKEALDSTLNTEVTIKGIIGSSVVNKSGFYLIDSTGAIAVLIDSSVLSTLELGNEVIIKGTITDTNGDKQGQIYIENSTIVSNFYGKHEYSTESFITDKTLLDVIALEKTPENTKYVYTVTGTIKFTESQYYSTVEIEYQGQTYSLYTSSGSQYSWLKAYANQEIEIELALCNWNGKALKGNIIAITVNGTKIINPINFTK